MCDSAATGGLPLIERPASGDSGTTVVVLTTGDGGSANADEKVAQGLVAREGAVVGFNMRAYLGRKRMPDEVGHDVACVAMLYMSRWHRDRFMLLGYSRGADLAPFVATRLPQHLGAHCRSRRRPPHHGRVRRDGGGSCRWLAAIRSPSRGA